MELVLLERLGRERAERVEADVQRHALGLEQAEQLGREVEAGRGGGRGARLVRVDGLVAARVGERLGDVGRQRRRSRRVAVQPQAPAPLAERLEQLDRPQALARAQLPRGPRQRLPDSRSRVAVFLETLEQQHLRRAAAGSPQVEPRGDDAGVVDDDELAAQLLRSAR